MSIIIAISGLHGTGKSTCAKSLAKKFNLKYASAGQAFREMAKKRVMSIEDLAKLASKDPSIDFEIDGMIIEEGEKGNAVLEGQLAAWMLIDVTDMNIMLTTPDEIRIKRIAKRDNAPLDTAHNKTFTREKFEKERFLKYYGVDFQDISIYDLIFDTSLLGERETIKTLKDMVQDYLYKKL